MKKWFAMLVTVVLLASWATAFAAVEVPSFAALVGEEAVYITADEENGLYLFQMESVEAAVNWANIFISELQYTYDFDSIQFLEGAEFYYVWLENYTGSETIAHMYLMEGVQYHVLCMVGLQGASAGKVIQCITPDLVLVDEFVYE